MGGYKNRILEVDLSASQMDTTDVSGEDKRRFIGGSGVSAKLFLDRFNLKAQPLSPDNPLIVMNGPITGTTLPGTSRFVACGKSPLTGIWGEGTCGGNFGPELKFAGMDGIIFKGVSPTPVYLSIEDDEIELRDDSELWGMDNYTLTDFLKQRHEKDKSPKILSIGQAGENLVKFAAICNDKGDFIGRTGIGL